MLKAILHGKAGRIEQNKDESVSWSTLFKAREDLLTSTVFERFAYLSENIQKSILQHWFKEFFGEAPTNLGELVNINYWPRFNHQHDNGVNQVEPDLVLNFTECDLIVEVKPPAGGDQYLKQWEKEIDSFLQSDDYCGKPLYFLAIGRVSVSEVTKWSERLLKNYQSLHCMAALEWKEVTEQIITLTTSPELTKQDHLILSDILEGLSLYGLQISPFKWSHMINDTCFNTLTLAHPDFSTCLNLCNATSNIDKLINNSFHDIDLQCIQFSLKA